MENTRSPKDAARKVTIVTTGQEKPQQPGPSKKRGPSKQPVSSLKPEHTAPRAVDLKFHLLK